MKKASIISNQINNLKERKQFDTLWDTTPSLMKINLIFKKFDNADAPEKQIYLKYIIVNLVSIIESFTRSSVKRLIDFGEPFFDNSKIFFDSKLKIDFDSFKHIHQREFTVGEFVSHQISCSNIEDFLGAFKIVLGDDLFKFLSKIDIPNQRIVFKNRVKMFVDERNNFTVIQKIFEMRHIICHENSLRLNIDEKLVRQGYAIISTLLKICGDGILYVLDNTTFMTLKDQVASQQTKLENLKIELGKLLKKIELSPQTAWEERINLETFLESQVLWERFALKHAETMSDVFIKHRNSDANDLSKKELELMYLDELVYVYDERVQSLKIDFNLS